MNSQLNATFRNDDGTISRFYIPVKENLLQKKNLEISKLTKYGLKHKYISESDYQTMEPNGKPGKLYGIPEK